MDFKDSLGTHSRVLILSPGNPRSDGPWFLSAMAPPSDGREDFSQMDRSLFHHHLVPPLSDRKGKQVGLEEDPSPEGLMEGQDPCLSSVLPGTSERVCDTKSALRNSPVPFLPPGGWGQS